ncbi:HAMP domain-containing sensor histidine kinase [Streptococcus iniae]|uniref:histidine kinase n=1 Tax=Streptococcus iniae TaxID=1346 RepID=A0A3L8GPS9_STRIN|nr:HAMP domain-containing sensor histidine kinase [Streptococcus iniae]AGM98055.1 sensor protein SrrB family protein [Streptococcus iniae SF1]AHY15126.1 histidine kinase [Streptococcus iniae]AHY16996.1 histidine kinase [Streptococcus iniae]AJG25313.1 histidine kinase [Streptococcus iniae]APD31187.1 two-component sensor histidine kinase [Streptococcus iniae]
MAKSKHLQLSLRYYFVLLFIGILLVTCFSGLFFICLLHLLFGVKGGLMFFIGSYTMVILLLGSLIMWQGSIHLTRPIQQLNQAVKEVAKGNFDYQVVRKKYPNDTADYHNELDELSQNLNQMAQDLKNLDQMRQEFISNVSHELKTPVASLVGVSDLLASHQLTCEDQAELLQIMQSETIRLSRLCDAILNLNRLDRDFLLEVKETRIDEQLRQAMILLTEKWKEKKISLEMPPHAVRLVTDPHLTMQVWINLLDNAIKYSGDDVRLAIAIIDQKDSISVVITDQGIGISKEDQRRLYEPFYQSDHSHSQEGNGLGLSIVKKIVTALSGTITITSQLGQGTKVSLTLPRNIRP